MKEIRVSPGVSEALLGRDAILASRAKKQRAAKTIQRTQRKRSEAKKRTRAATTIQRKQRERSAAKRNKSSRRSSSSSGGFTPRQSLSRQLSRRQSLSRQSSRRQSLSRQSSGRLPSSRGPSRSNASEFPPRSIRQQLLDAKTERDRLMRLRELRQASMQPGAMPKTYQGRVPNIPRSHYDNLGRVQFDYEGHEIPVGARLVRQHAITPQKYRESRLLSEFPPSRMG